MTYCLLGKAKRLHASQPVDLFIALALFLMLTVFALTMFGMANQFPSLFDAGYFIPKNETRLPLIIGSILALPFCAWGQQFAAQEKIKNSRVFQLLNETVAGILLAGFFSSFT